MFRYLFVISLLLVFLTACVPAAPDATVPQAEDAAETSATVQEVSDEDADAHEEGDHGDEEGEHSDDDAGHEEGDHGDEDADHEEGDHGDEDADHEEGDHGDEDADHNDDDDAHGHEDENEQREHGAHEHGAAELMIAWSGNEMVIDLETPSYNVLGFEYVPTSDAEKDLLMESVTALEEGDLLQVNPDAECTIVSANVQSALLEEDSHDAEADDEDDHDAETHSDIDVSYNLECQQPDNIEALDASQFFAQFPNFQAIQVQWISDTQQSATDLTPDNPVLSFKQ